MEKGVKEEKWEALREVSNKLVLGGLGIPGMAEDPRKYLPVFCDVNLGGLILPGMAGSLRKVPEE